MSANESRDHHYVPQFYLRNFAVDESRHKVTTVARHGPLAIWAERSILSLGYERDFYVHVKDGETVSVETAINRRLETPISESVTWRKIAEGRAHELDQSDRPVLYALVRHLEARTPHYLETMRELAEMAADPNSQIMFGEQERARYAEFRATPGLDRERFNAMATTTQWSAAASRGAIIMVMRSPIPLRTSTVPVMAIRSPDHTAISLPMQGMVPFQRVLTLNPTTAVSIVDGAFGGYFKNFKISLDAASALNRHRLCQFCYFPEVRHLLTGRQDLVEEMTWAPYKLAAETSRKITFRRRP